MNVTAIASGPIPVICPPSSILFTIQCCWPILSNQYNLVVRISIDALIDHHGNPPYSKNPSTVCANFYENCHEMIVRMAFIFCVRIYLCKEHFNPPNSQRGAFWKQICRKKYFFEVHFLTEITNNFFWLPKRYAFSVVASFWKIVKWLWKKLEVEVKNFRIS